MAAYRPVTNGSYAPCNFDPFGPPDYTNLPVGSQLSLPPMAQVPNPFLFDRGTAQFAKAKVSWPINMPKVRPNPPTKMSFATIQSPWAQFDLRGKAPCNVWSRHEVPMPPSGNMYGETESDADAQSKGQYSKALVAISALSAGLILISALRSRR